MLCDTCIYYDCEDIQRYSREQDAAKRVNYLNGGDNGT